MKAVRGAWSIDAVECRSTRKAIAKGRVVGTGIKERKIDEGKCVNAIVC